MVLRWSQFSMTLGYGTVYTVGSKRECGYELGNCERRFQTDLSALGQRAILPGTPRRVEEGREIDKEPLTREGLAALLC